MLWKIEFIFFFILLIVIENTLSQDACSRDQFDCGDSNCIDINDGCNGFVDCNNGSDEINCLTCTKDAFHCQNSLQCIADYRECDGIEDCEDKTDEDPNICGHEYEEHNQTNDSVNDEGVTESKYFTTESSSKIDKNCAGKYLDFRISIQIVFFLTLCNLMSYL